MYQAIIKNQRFVCEMPDFVWKIFGVFFLEKENVFEIIEVLKESLPCRKKG